MAEVNVTIAADLAVEAMVLSGAGSPQEAVELAVRDFVARGHRTEARTGRAEQHLRDVDAKPQDPQG